MRPRQGLKGKAKKGLGKARCTRPQGTADEARGGWPDNKGETALKTPPETRSLDSNLKMMLRLLDKVHTPSG